MDGSAVVYLILALLALGVAAGLFVLRSKKRRTPETPAKPLPREPAPDVSSKATDVSAPRAPSERPPPVVAPAVERTASSTHAVQPPTTRSPSLPPIPTPAEDLASLRKGLASTRGGFVSRLAQLFKGRQQIDPELLEQIEEVLITADIGVRTTSKILENLRARLARNELENSDRVWDAIREEATAILEPSSPKALSFVQRPTVILVVGVNGVGKTTTIGKLASRLTMEGKRVVLAAGDTFRAAAVLQLEVWGRRVGCPVVRGKENADPASVIFEAIKRGKEEGADVVIADTAGRLHTKTPLMDELKKVGRTVEKALDGRPADEVVLVLDCTNGQNAIQQAQMFREALPVSGIILTKVDGTAKGGVVLGIVDEHKIPIRYLGVGERIEDLREFDSDKFVEALFSKSDDEPLAA